MSDFRKWQMKFYKSKKWRDLREIKITQNKKQYNDVICHCDKCKLRILKRGNDKRGYTYIDHIKEITVDNKNNTDIILNINNLQVLCHACHNTKTFSNKEYDFDLKNRKDINLF